MLSSTGISYMNARFEVTVGDSHVQVKVLHGREILNIFVDHVQQKATESTCKYQHQSSCKDRLFCAVKM